MRTALRCDDCNGTVPARGTKPVTCSECNGRGQVQRVRQSMLGQMVTPSACPKCGGLGQVIVTPCPTCSGDGRVITEKTYQVDVPAGVDTGSHAAAHRPRRGRPAWRRHRATCTCTSASPRTSRSAARATTSSPMLPGLDRPGGARHQVRSLPTLDGDEEIVVPAGTQPGREFVLRQRGVPRLQGRGRGDLRVRVNVQVPTKLTEFETELLKKFAEARGEEVAPREPGLFSRIKSAFQ